MNNFLFIFFLLCFTRSEAQIFFTNPSLEGVSSGFGNDVPPSWEICSATPDILPVTCCPWYKSAFEGMSYEGIQCDSSNWAVGQESFGQKISCNLIPHFTSSFQVYLFNLIDTVNVPVYKWGGVLQIFGGFNSCDMDTLLWQSPELDSVWHQYDVVFIPNKAYNYLTFLANNFNIYDGNGNKRSYIGVDALSEITVQGYNFFSFPNTDSTINKGACVSFTASSDDTAATFYWSTTAGDSVATADSINICPASTTTYICTATLGCGQQFRDTITVTVLGGGSSGTPILKIPNLLSTDYPTWQIVNATSGMQVTIYNTLGQLVYKNKEYNNTLNINTLAGATYFYEVKYGSNTYRGKLIVIR